MNFKNWLLTEQKSNIDEIGYGKTTEERYLRNIPTPLFGNDWKKIKLKPFPLNSSKETRKELEKIVKLQENASSELKKVIKRQDRYDVETEFFLLFEKLGKKLTNKQKAKITQIMKELTTISLYFKERFNRPRPHQIAQKVDPSFPSLKVKTGSASYPSAHALIGEYLALHLSDEYPQFEKELKKLGKELGENRVIGGFHYPSDFDAGVLLARKLYQLKR